MTLRDWLGLFFYAVLFASAPFGLSLAWQWAKRKPAVRISEDTRRQWECERFAFQSMKALNTPAAKGFKADTQKANFQ